MCMISNGGHLFIMCGYCYYGFTTVDIFGPAPHFIVASAAYAVHYGHLGTNQKCLDF